MTEPTSGELADSVIRAGRDWGVEVTAGADGVLRIVRRREVAVEPAVEIRFTEDEILEYYRRIADEAERGIAPEGPWDWWMTLMSTHLVEALDELGRVGRPCAITIGRTGFTVTSAAED
ncbi:hypothetical protein [Nocardia sp. NPDC057030]|uniref:hypothetical protein n=1 Tax=unclassified Nocardia TaxID=2637762 RepID=UPI003638F81B